MGIPRYRAPIRVRVLYWIVSALGVVLVLGGLFSYGSYQRLSRVAREGRRVTATIVTSDHDTVTLTVPGGGTARRVTIRREGPSLCDYNPNVNARAGVHCDPIDVLVGDHIGVVVDRRDPTFVRPADALDSADAGTSVTLIVIGAVILVLSERGLWRLAHWKGQKG